MTDTKALDGAPPELTDVGLAPEEEQRITAEIAQTQALRKAGHGKPSETTWGDWMGPKKMSPHHYVIAQMVALGMGSGLIAKELRMQQSRISILLTNSLIKAYAEKIRAYVTKDAKTRFERLIPKSVGVFEDILDDEQAQSKLKADIAGKVLDRAWGKPNSSEAETGNTALQLIRAVNELIKTSKNDPENDPKISNTIQVETTEAEIVNEVTETQVQKTDQDPLSSLLNDWEGENNIENDQEKGKSEGDCVPDEES